MINMSKKQETPHGGQIEQEIKVGCENWQKTYCIQMRAENEPETLLTETEGVLKCPVCNIVIDRRDNNE